MQNFQSFAVKPSDCNNEDFGHLQSIGKASERANYEPRLMKTSQIRKTLELLSKSKKFANIPCKTAKVTRLVRLWYLKKNVAEIIVKLKLDREFDY